MDLGISGRCALVMAGGGGLGSGIAKALANEGADVVVAGRTQEPLDATVADIRSRGGNCESFLCDLADLASIDRLMVSIRNSFGNPDILINMTGGPPPSGSSGIDPELWTAQFNSMIRSVIYTTDLVLPGMREKQWGRVITNSSSGAIVPLENLMMSNTLRGSLHGWSKTLSRDVAIDGVTVNVVVPGRIMTKRIAQLDQVRAAQGGRELDDVVKESTKQIPIGRYGTPEEYGAAVAFLASKQASYITGSIFRVDGGLISSI